MNKYLPAKCLRCQFCDGAFECSVFADPFAAQSMPGGCSAFAGNPSVVRIRERARQNALYGCVRCDHEPVIVAARKSGVDNAGA